MTGRAAVTAPGTALAKAAVVAVAAGRKGGTTGATIMIGRAAVTMAITAADTRTSGGRAAEAPRIAAAAVAGRTVDTTRAMTSAGGGGGMETMTATELEGVGLTADRGLRAMAGVIGTVNARGGSGPYPHKGEPLQHRGVAGKVTPAVV